MDELKSCMILLIVVGLIISGLFLLIVLVEPNSLTKPFNFFMGEEGKIIEHCEDGIICRQYNLISQPVCFKDKDMVKRWCKE